MTGKVYTFPWHNDECVRQQEYIDNDGYKRFFCKNHHQWASERPVKTELIFTYGDGETHKKVSKYKPIVTPDAKG